jgi:hypothetical protein
VSRWVFKEPPRLERGRDTSRNPTPGDGGVAKESGEEGGLPACEPARELAREFARELGPEEEIGFPVVAFPKPSRWRQLPRGLSLLCSVFSDPVGLPGEAGADDRLSCRASSASITLCTKPCGNVCGLGARNFGAGKGDCGSKVIECANLCRSSALLCTFTAEHSA